MKRAVLLAICFGAWACSSETTTYVSDAAPLGSFGDPCAEPSDCESGVCVPSGVTGVCSETCTEGSCPAGFGCQTAGGQSVCVPDNPLLCTICADDSECAEAGDACLTGVNGKSFCAQDCSSLGCPIGYECQTVEIDGASAEQCVPVSGACDCNAATSDAVEDCTITHAFGTCAGSRRCQGAAGWSACEPPSATDPPDPSFADDNCDGIDGDASAAIFVAPSGADDAGCGLGHDAPCRSVGHALTRAAEEGKTSLFLQAGVYEEGEPIVLRSGVHLVGGYDTGWQRGLHTDPAHRVVLRGGPDADTGALVTLEASNIDAATLVADLVIAGPSGAGQTGAASYAVFVEGSSGLALERVTIEGGNGAPGAAGADGISASPSPAPIGQPGAPGTQLTAVCNDDSRAAGGDGGAYTCSGTDTSGGDGGDSGTIDTNCPVNLAPTEGEAGEDVPPSSPGGKGGEICGAGGPGDPGTSGANGTGGTGAPAGGTVIGSLYATNAGGVGGLGSHGRGGDGGGGAGACETGTDAYGGGGGGGGAGGCRAETGGDGGEGGGASFGLYAIDSEVVASGCAIERGDGGNGGRGGSGGTGQPGGQGGPAGPGAGNAQAGGRGGRGGKGGDSGGGGGGAGGDSVGIATRNSTVSHDCTITGGAPGTGGPGGSATANDGAPGATGRVLDLLEL